METWTHNCLQWPQTRVHKIVPRNRHRTHYTCSEVCREECKRGLIKLIAFSLLVHCGGSSSRSNFRSNCTEALAFTEADNEAACAHHHQHSVGYGLGTKMETFIFVWNSLLCLPLLPNSISHDSASTNIAFLRKTKKRWKNKAKRRVLIWSLKDDRKEEELEEEERHGCLGAPFCLQYHISASKVFSSVNGSSSSSSEELEN